MVFNEEQYRAIRTVLLQKNCNNIQELKLHFRDEINSQRDFEKIQTLVDLFNILEKREVIGCDHEENLRFILNIVAPDILIESIVANNTIPRNSNHVGSLPGYIRVSSSLETKIERIYSLIRSDIGWKWREFARALGVSEGLIDILNNKYRADIYEMVNEILQRHDAEYGSNFEQWRSKLQEALVKARRSDLSDRINEILSRN